MCTPDYLTILNILIAFIGVLFVFLTVLEWQSLRRMRKDFAALEEKIRKEFYTSMRSAHKVIASYGVKYLDARIALLETAVSEKPSAYNGYNALGYAYMERGDIDKAIEAFQQATKEHPDDKAGYCDLAHAYLQANQTDLAVKYFKKAITVDASARNDIMSDTRVSDDIKKRCYA